MQYAPKDNTSSCEGKGTTHQKLIATPPHFLIFSYTLKADACKASTSCLIASTSPSVCRGSSEREIVTVLGVEGEGGRGR